MCVYKVLTLSNYSCFAIIFSTHCRSFLTIKMFHSNVLCVLCILIGRLDAKQAAKKWKMLRDSYSRELAKEKLPSGSGQPTSKRKWKHFNRMDFLRDTICTKK